VELRESALEIQLMVKDDGCGLPRNAGMTPGFGLRGMNYRASLIQGDITIRNGEQGGTDVICCVPKR
jgi:signal transduction histidine kinase